MEVWWLFVLVFCFHSSSMKNTDDNQNGKNYFFKMKQNSSDFIITSRIPNLSYTNRNENKNASDPIIEKKTAYVTTITEEPPANETLEIFSEEYEDLNSTQVNKTVDKSEIPSSPETNFSKENDTAKLQSEEEPLKIGRKLYYKIMNMGSYADFLKPMNQKIKYFQHLALNQISKMKLMSEEEDSFEVVTPKRNIIPRKNENKNSTVRETVSNCRGTINIDSYVSKKRVQKKLPSEENFMKIKNETTQTNGSTEIASNFKENLPETILAASKSESVFSEEDYSRRVSREKNPSKTENGKTQINETETINSKNKNNISGINNFELMTPEDFSEDTVLERFTRETNKNENGEIQIKKSVEVTKPNKELIPESHFESLSLESDFSEESTGERFTFEEDSVNTENKKKKTSPGMDFSEERASEEYNSQTPLKKTNTIDPKVAKEFREQITKIGNKCVKETNAASEDVRQIMAHQIPASHEGKCMISCVYKAFKIQNIDGSMNVEEAIKLSEKIKESNPKLFDKMVLILKKCLGVAERTKIEDHCLAAISLAACSIIEGKATGISSDMFGL